MCLNIVFLYFLFSVHLKNLNNLFLCLADIDIKVLGVFVIVWILILLMVYAIYKLKKEK